MGQKVTFDPINKIVQVDIAPIAGVIELDVKIDLYSDMKEDWRVNPSLMKFRPPIRSVGGDPLPGSKALGATFFMDSDWVIRPYDADHRFIVNGNLYKEDGSSPFIQTVGVRNVLIESTVSSLVDSTIQQASEIENMSFQNKVWIDSVNGGVGTGYPNGNSEFPVKYVSDAVAIAQVRGFNTLIFIGPLTIGLGDDVAGFTIQGTNPVTSILNMLPAAVADDCYIKECFFTGTLDGGSILRDCVLGEIHYFSGFIEHCALTAATIFINGQAVLMNCVASATCLDSPPVLDLSGTTGLAVRGYSGSLIAVNKTATANCEIDINGIFIIEPTVVDGTFTVYGDGYVINNGTGNSTVIDRTTGSPQEISEAVWNNADNYVNGTKGGLLSNLKHLSLKVYIDEELTDPGDGSQRYPFNSITLAIDYAELKGINDLMLKSDITLDRNLKNFRLTGIGNPTVNTNGKDLKGSEFFHCNMEGDYLGQITVQQAVLKNNFWLNGNFERCVIEGNLYCKDDSFIVMLYCSSAVAGTNRPAIYGNALGYCNLNIRDYVGGMNVRGFVQPTSVMTIDGKGALTFEASNVEGIMVARGRWEPFLNLANGATVVEPVGDQSKIDTIAADVWNHTQ